jgi:predicted MFS family arabinose efflux permease
MVDDKEDLSNAIALNSSMVNLARLIGPMISGIVLYKMGAGICFMLNAASFMAVILSLLMMNLPAFLPQIKTKKILEELKDGLNYIKATPSIGIMILLLSFISLLVLPYVTLLPIIAKETLQGNALTYGFLNSFTGIGALIAAIFLASVKKQTDLRKVLVIATAIFGLGLILFSYAQSLVLAFIFATLTGFGMMLHVTIINTLL